MFYLWTRFHFFRMALVFIALWFWVIFCHFWSLVRYNARRQSEHSEKIKKNQADTEIFVFSCKASLTLPATPKSPSQTRWNAQTVQKGPGGVFAIFRIRQKSWLEEPCETFSGFPPQLQGDERIFPGGSAASPPPFLVVLRRPPPTPRKNHF